MITDLPTFDDLNGSAVALLNMAWVTALGVFRVIEQTQLETWDDDGSVRVEYHASRQPALRHALVMVHQAQELGLKARIAAVSPYLLLVGEPRISATVLYFVRPLFQRRTRGYLARATTVRAAACLWPDRATRFAFCY